LKEPYMVCGSQSLW